MHYFVWLPWLSVTSVGFILVVCGSVALGVLVA